MIEYDYIAATRAGAAQAGARVLILMHGRGANRQDLAPLHSRLPDDWHVILPDAPHSAAEWGYGPGRAWYQFLGGDRPEMSSLESSLNALDELITALPSIVGSPVSHLVLGGFSQGGTMGNAYALIGPASIQGVLNFSGFLPSTLPVAGDALNGVRFFWGHGMQDANIPFALALKGRSVLQEAGADLETHDYAIGHWIDPVELRDASAWLNAF